MEADGAEISARMVVFLVGLAAGWIAEFLKSYLTTKGQNLATKEDIATITREVEAVKDDFTKVRQREGQQHQLSMAALDRRLEALQQAYCYASDLPALAHEKDSDKQDGQLLEMHDWLRKNCLYLGADVADGFLSAVNSARHHRNLLGGIRDSAELVNENWERVERVRVLILRAANLPDIGQPYGAPDSTGTVDSQSHP